MTNWGVDCGNATDQLIICVEMVCSTGIKGDEIYRQPSARHQARHLVSEVM